MNVAEIEVGLEAVRIEADRPLVKSLRFDHLVARVVDVGEIDDRRHEIGIDDERLPIRCSRPLHVSLLAIVQAGAFDEVLRGERGLRIGEGERLVRGVPHHRCVGRQRRAAGDAGRHGAPSLKRDDLGLGVSAAA